MVLSDDNAVKQIIGSLMRNTLLFADSNINPMEDFDQKLPRICYVAIYNLYLGGAEHVTTYEVDKEINREEGSLAARDYKKFGGLEWLINAFEFAQVENYQIYYNRVKKYALLRRLNREGYNISQYYISDDDIIKNPALAANILETQERFDSASIDEILNCVESKFNVIRNDYLNGGKTNGDPSVGLEELVEDLKNSPSIGVPLNGNIFSAACRGAREGCFYLKSASTSAGKTRTSVFDACKIAYPERYSLDENTFIQEFNDDGVLREPQRVLFIVTEMDITELQTIILAYLAKVNEDHILTGQYYMGEYERVQYAVKIVEKYREFFIVEEISDPNLVNIEATIKKYVTLKDVKYIFFDYIHTTAAMLSQFSRNNLREDSILMLMANQLKQLAKNYHVFIFSATQVNALAMNDDGEFKNEMCIRGSKAVADKTDLGYVMTSVTAKMWQSLIPQLKAAANKGLLSSSVILDDELRPTHVLDIYKMRRGRWKNVRIWTRLDLGTGERKDIFMTTPDNEPITTKITVYNLYVEYPYYNWKEELTNA